MPGACCNDHDEERIRRIGESFDLSAEDHLDEYEKKGLSSSSRVLIGLLSEKDQLRDRALLDLGCGSGRFSVEALLRGAKSTVGMDLSSKMIATAQRLASRRNLAGKAIFHVGDAAVEDHPVSDIVVLDKVICCYPLIDPLLSKASAASRDRIGLIVPRDAGLARIPVRIGVYLENLIDRARHDPVRMYLHSLRRIDEFLERSGFQRVNRRVSGFWIILVYTRQA